MREITKINTAIGEFTVQYGPFMSGDEKNGKYHCWFNGCGIGGESKSFSVSEKYLHEWAIVRLTQSLKEHEKKVMEIKKSLAYIKALGGEGGR